MSKRKAPATLEPPRKRLARLSPAFSDDYEEERALDLPDESEGDDVSADEEDVGDDEPPAFAQYMGESDLEDVEDESSEAETDLNALQDQLASVPMGALLQARKSIDVIRPRKTAPAPLPPISEEPAPAKKRPRASKSGRTVPRYASAMTADDDEPAAPLPGFLTGANAAQPGVKKERREKKEVHGRESRHGPAVMSSKRAVPRARQVVEVVKAERRDPRFDTLSGGFDQTRFNKAYDFLDDARAAELAELRNKVKAKSSASLSLEERERQRKALTRLESQMERRRREERERAVLADHRRTEREQRAQGKKPYHLKRSEEKQLLEAARLEELEKAGKGKLKKAMKKREMKAAQKERKHRPPPRALGP